MEPPPLKYGAAQSIPIGWFADLSADGPRRMFTPPRESAGPRPGIKQAAGPPGLSDDLVMRLAATLQPPLAILLSPHDILEWPAPLLPFQREGVFALISRRELLLADDMGLGKTIQAIAALRILFLQQKIESAQIVCPASLVAQWLREIARWAPDLTVIKVLGASSERGVLWKLPAQIKLISYDTLRGDVLELRDSPALRRPWGVVALDEAARIKNAETRIAIACKRLPRQRRWALKRRCPVSSAAAVQRSSCA
ncbi:MAG TPA: SNF2-related protein [Chthonomonadales bacterium]|nr:SNF2-related protein [Chthonomonadales bacterium]